MANKAGPKYPDFGGYLASEWKKKSRPLFPRDHASGWCVWFCCAWCLCVPAFGYFLRCFPGFNGVVLLGPGCTVLWRWTARFSRSFRPMGGVGTENRRYSRGSPIYPSRPSPMRLCMGGAWWFLLVHVSWILTGTSTEERGTSVLVWVWFLVLEIKNFGSFTVYIGPYVYAWAGHGGSCWFM